MKPNLRALVGIRSQTKARNKGAMGRYLGDRSPAGLELRKAGRKADTGKSDLRAFPVVPEGLRRAGGLVGGIVRKERWRNSYRLIPSASSELGARAQRGEGRVALGPLCREGMQPSTKLK